jgi:hypothetical protein
VAKEHPYCVIRIKLRIARPHMWRYERHPEATKDLCSDY